MTEYLSNRAFATRMAGSVIRSVSLDTTKTLLTIRTTEGTLHGLVQGDCCSSSWIEHLEAPNDIAGATITGLTDSGSVEVTHADHECLQVYNTAIQTTRGEIVIEYRNSSNGYYGGWIDWSLETK